MNNLQVQFRSLQKAYHYTTFQTAIKILESKSLRFGKLNNMNDFHENDKLCFVDSDKNPIGPNSFDVLEALQDGIYKYRQISFPLIPTTGKDLTFTKCGDCMLKREMACVLYLTMMN